MQNFTFLIGSMDYFSSDQDLTQAWQSEEQFSKFNYHASAYHISLSEECKIEGCSTLAAIAVEIGRGRAMAGALMIPSVFSWGNEHEHDLVPCVFCL